MTIKVLVVDDSSFFRRRVSDIVTKDPELEVIGTAVNGVEAVKMTAELRPNVITMDVEMPVMDGICAVREIMAKTPTPIIMFSSLTHDGAKATFDALEAGALDFLPKRFEDIATNKNEAVLLLQQRIKELGRKRLRPLQLPHTASSSVARPLAPSKSPFPLSSGALARSAPVSASTRVPIKGSGKQYKLLIIGTSTGGPVALQKILTQLPANYPHPILLIQHMPAAFTPAFASRLNGLCNILVKEAESGEKIRPGTAYLAPGGMQMMLDRGGTHGRLIVVNGNADMNYKPSVDITFASASKLAGGKILAVVLTGMGSDGKEGARLLKNAGATIWSQDEASSVVYGMPQAVTNAGLSSMSIGLEDMAESIIRESAHG